MPAVHGSCSVGWKVEACGEGQQIVVAGELETVLGQEGRYLPGTPKRTPWLAYERVGLACYPQQEAKELPHHRVDQGLRLIVQDQPTPRSRELGDLCDASAATHHLVDAGAELLAPPTLTPWASLNARLQAPAGLQITLFEELRTCDVHRP